jgi:endonuclease/exonuclease/phosphatase (EEP) superfamily protein YafD
MRLVRAAVAVVLLTLAAGFAVWSFAALGGAVSDRLDVLTHFAPLALAGALVTLVACRLLIRRGRLRRNASLLALAGVVWSGALMAPELLAAARPPAPPDGPTIRVVQFNVWGRNSDPAATAAWVLSTGADVVTMQETDGVAAEDVVARLRRAYPHGAVCFEARCSLAVLSRWPVRGAEVQRQHWSAPDAKALSGAWAEIRHPAGSFTVLTTHYTWPTYVYAQEWQRRTLLSLVRPHRREDLIVTGDFNLTPWSKALHEQDARLGLERRTRALSSWPTAASRIGSPLPLLPIDHVYAGRAWRTVAVERGPRLGSDHYPVVVTLSRAAPPARAPGSPAPSPRSGRGTSGPDRSPAR